MSKQTASTIEVSGATASRIEYVPYSRLCLSPLNVRKKPPTALEPLAETIGQRGLMQNLVVHEIPGRTKLPKLGVCAGQRRLAALGLLVAQERITTDYLVPVLIVSEGEAVAASLIENREREDMHIADECVAFRLLLDEGRSVAHIAALFKVSEVAVWRALKIASLAPSLLDLLREDRLDYDQAKALVLADDHATQERVWHDAQNAWQRRPSELRAALTQAETNASENPLARFVGLDVYEAAGGFVRRDLFSDDENAGFIADADLLHRLATDKLVAVSQTIAAEGWGWIETRTRFDVSELFQFDRIASSSREPTESEREELEALKTSRDLAQAGLDAYYASEEDEVDDDQWEALEQAVTAAADALNACGERFIQFSPDDMKDAGAYVAVDEDGAVQVTRGLRRRDSNARNLIQDVRQSSPDRDKSPRQKPLHGERLCKRLTAHRTAAVQIELAQQPTIALAVLMYRMIPTVFDDIYGYSYHDHAVRIDARTSREALLSNADDMAASVAWKALEGEREKWTRMLPDHEAKLLAWLLEQQEDVLSNLFAFCVAMTVDGISATDQPHSVNELSNTLGVDISYYWKPTHASYFAHISKDRIATVVGENVSEQAALELRGMKKDDAAKSAEARMSETGWLPEVLSNRETPERVTYNPREEDDEDEIPECAAGEHAEVN